MLQDNDHNNDSVSYMSLEEGLWQEALCDLPESSLGCWQENLLSSQDY